MIVVITSWAPVRALRKPAMPPQTAPPTKPAITATTTCSTRGRSQVNPTQPAHMAPTTSWPAPPMLNRPARNARGPGLAPVVGAPAPSPDRPGGAAASVTVMSAAPGRSTVRAPASRATMGCRGAAPGDARSCDRDLFLAGGDLDLGRLLHGAGHQQADAVAAGLLAVEDPDDPTPVDHGYAVGERQHLVQLRRVEQNADPLVPLGDHLAVDVLDGAHVQAPGRLRQHQQAVGMEELSGDDHLLLVAARQRRRRRLHRRGADVELVDQLLRVFADGPTVDAQAAGERPLVDLVEHEVGGHCERVDETVALAVLRHVGQTGAEEVVGWPAGDVAAVEPDRSG